METNFATVTFSIFRRNSNDIETFTDFYGNYMNFKYINFINTIDWKVQECTKIEDAIKIAKKKKKETNFDNVYFYIITNNKVPQIVAIY